MAGNYIPRSDADFDVWFDTLVREVVIHTTGAEPEWYHITAEAKAALQGKHDEWKDALGAAQADPTAPKIREKNRVRKVSEKEVREFVNQFLRHPPVTDEQRDVLGVVNPDHTKTPSPIPTAGPPSKTVAVSAAPGVVQIIYLGAKPKGVDRIEAAYGVADEPITDFAKLTERTTITHNPLEITLLEQRKKTLSYALRYLLKGAESPWTEIRNVTIP
jgi:hypothetical protein